MDLPQMIEVLCGGVAVYVGARFLLKRRIPVVNEGEDMPLAWITGWEAVVAGCLAIAFGLYLFALATGFLPQPHGS